MDVAKAEVSSKEEAKAADAPTDTKKALAVGIDLGTTYSCVGVFRNNLVEIIANDMGNRTTPSYVAFTDTERLCGDGAKSQCATNPSNTVFDAKRLIGRSFDDPIVQQDMTMWPFTVIDEGDNKPKIKVMYKEQERIFSPEEISSMVLVKMKETAEAFLGTPVKDAVVTCPAYFNDLQRNATKTAGLIAGLNVLRVINEPTAAAIAYGLGKREEHEQEKKDKKAQKVRLGIDQASKRRKLAAANKDSDSDSDSSKNGSDDDSDDDDDDDDDDKPKPVVEESSDEEDNDEVEKIVLVFDLGGGTFDVSVLGIDNGVFEVKATAGDTHLGGEDFDTKLMEHVLKQWGKKNRGCDPTKNNKSIRRLRTACERAKRTLSSSTSTTVQVDGFFEGSDLMVTISRARFEMLCDHFFKNCMLPVNQVLMDLKLAKQRVDEVVLVGGSTRIPKIHEMIKAAFHGKEPCTSINPDEAVAYGAAVQAAILTGDTSESTQDLLLIDVAPLSLGIETAGGNMSVLIKRNTPIPVKASRQFSTNQDDQTCVEVIVYEGERVKTADNNMLAKFDLEGIPKLPAGVPRIEVKFELDANGLLHVSAIELTTKRKQKCKISNSGRLTADEISKMVQDAEAFQEQDMAQVTIRKAKIELENCCLQIKKCIDDPKLRIGIQDYEFISKALTWISGWIAGTATLCDEPAEEYTKQQKKLEEMVEPILIKLYKGHGLAAQNMGLMFNRKKKNQLLIEGVKEERAKLLEQQRAKMLT